LKNGSLVDEGRTLFHAKWKLTCGVVFGRSRNTAPRAKPLAKGCRHNSHAKPCGYRVDNAWSVIYLLDSVRGNSGLCIQRAKETIAFRGEP
jgi:hypothetical protein